MERVADRVLDALDLKGHQVVIVSHRDREHPHMHLLINRVHPDTGLAWNRWRDRAVLQQVLRDEEQALGQHFSIAETRALTDYWWRIISRTHDIKDQ